MKSGRLDIHKQPGMSSHDVVHQIRKKLNIKRVGHSGTLDPMAEGVLSVYVGAATKFIDLLKDSYKSYTVWFECGKESDTFDIMGTVKNVTLPDIDFQQMTKMTESFLGKQWQVPPKYSAIKVAGKPLYRYAREGIDVEIKAREIEIKAIELLAWDGQHGNIRLTCSKGTYIRSLVVDLADKFGTRAVMTRLIRTENDFVSLADCISLDEVSEAMIRPPDAFHPGPRVEISPDLVRKLAQGLPRVIDSSEQADRILLTCQGQFVGTAVKTPQGYIREKIYHDIS